MPIPTWIWLLILFIICQRLIELFIAKRNEKWMKERGGIEFGNRHYKWFIGLHTFFFISLIIEIIMRNSLNINLNFFIFSIFILTQLIRIWCLFSLGRFWNTKIIILPNANLSRRGPYKFVRHPNYIIVGLELIIIPLMFGAYFTAIVFPILHILLLQIRIPQENQALDRVISN